MGSGSPNLVVEDFIILNQEKYVMLYCVVPSTGHMI